MSQVVDRFVHECDSCQRRKRGNEFQAPLGAVRQPSQPFETCRMNLVSLFALSANKNRYLLTFIDQLTKNVEAVAVPDMTASTCAKAYATQVVARHGTGQALVTDRSASFMVAFFKVVCKILGVQHLMISAPLHLCHLGCRQCKGAHYHIRHYELQTTF
jgi:hypothetical protein